MVKIFLQSLSVRARVALMSSNLSLNLLWSSNMNTSELLMMASFTIGEEVISCISCVTTPTIAQCFLAVL
ncbi:Uncharacterised protein [Segatella copri]|nr:Uncharacterised protein [Segatella copri]